jgi:hypothetical protein
MSSLDVCGVAPQCIGSGEAESSERTQRAIRDQATMVEKIVDGDGEPWNFRRRAVRTRTPPRK